MIDDILDALAEALEENENLMNRSKVLEKKLEKLEDNINAYSHWLFYKEEHDANEEAKIKE